MINKERSRKEEEGRKNSKSGVYKIMGGEKAIDMG